MDLAQKIHTNVNNKLQYFLNLCGLRNTFYHTMIWSKIFGVFIREAFIS